MAFDVIFLSSFVHHCVLANMISGERQLIFFQLLYSIFVKMYGNDVTIIYLMNKYVSVKMLNCTSHRNETQYVAFVAELCTGSFGIRMKIMCYNL